MTKEFIKEIGKLKKLTVNRGKSSIDFKARNGDIYTDTLTVKLGQKKLYFTNYANSDPTIGYKGGIIEKGNYLGLIGDHKGKYESIKLFQTDSLDRVKQLKELVEKAKTDKKKNSVWKKLTRQERTFVSEIPNRNHGNKKIIQLVAVHKGGYSWDFSHGCITILKTNYKRFIDIFSAGEILIVEIK